MESTPLLAGDYAAVKTFPEMRSVFTQETVKMWKIAGPVAFYTVCQYGLNSVTSMFVGHIGDLELSAVAMSLSVIGTFTTGFMLGMGSALETLCGQAYGAGQVHMLGIYMQRSWIILLVSCFFLLPVYIFATPILVFLGQEEAIANLAGKFTLQVIPQLFSLAINFPTGKFLQAQSKVNAVAWIAFLLIFVLELGTTGAALAYDITSWGVALAQVVYVIGWCNEGWSGFSWLAFKDLWGFVKLSLASAVMLCLEIWYLMSIIVLTGHLGNAVIAVGSLSICMNFNGWEAMIFIGISAATSVRVSNELGSGRPRAAKYAVYIIVAQSFIIGLLCMVAVLITKDYFAVIFTNSKDLQVAVSKLAFLLGITMVLNSVQPVISGVAIGAGWQGLVAYINVFCYYVFGLPLGFLLGYKANLGVTTLLLLIILYRTNWNKEVEETSERMRRWGGEEVKPKGKTNGV
ncbi:Protein DETOXIFICATION 35 [Linum perenne]